MFSSLRRLEVVNCKKMRKVGLPVSRVPNLDYIEISECGDIEEIFEKDERRTASILTTLPKLKYLMLQGLPRLRKVGFQVWGLPNLERIDIRDCGEIEDVVSIVTTLTLTLPKLRHLTLVGLPRLRKVGLPV